MPCEGLAGVKIRHRYAAVQGLRCHYLESGEGPPLLLVASQVVLARSYLPLIRRLSAHFRVLTLELPGCGHSVGTGEYWPPERYADWLAGFIRTVGIGPATVMGHSNSGPVALMLGAHHPELAARLLLIDSIGARAWPSLLSVLAGRAVDSVLEPWLTLRAWPHPLYNVLFHTRNFVGQVKLAARLDVLGAASSVRVPTLIGWGCSDRTMPPAGAERLRVQILGAKVYFSRWSHDWCVTEPGEFTRVVVEFAKGGSALPAGCARKR